MRRPVIAMPLEDPETLARVGARLRARRLELGLPIEEVSSATRIRVHHLEAIEQGRVDTVPSGAYLRGFVRLYAERLGLDPCQLVRACEPPPLPPAEPEPDPPKRRRWRPRRRVWALAAVLAVAVGTFALHRPAAAPGAVPTPKALPQAAHSAPATTPKPITVRLRAAFGQLVLFQVSGAPSITVEARTVGHCWVSVWSDGQPVLTRTLPAGIREVWRVRRRLWVRVGDLGALKLSVDGVALRPLADPSPQTLDFRLVPIQVH